MAETHGTATSTATGELGDYLDRLDAALGLPVEERASVREEIAAHLFVEQASLTAAGDPPAAALTTAIGRLGDPAGLGRDLTRARQTGARCSPRPAPGPGRLPVPHSGAG